MKPELEEHDEARALLRSRMNELRYGTQARWTSFFKRFNLVCGSNGAIFSAVFLYIQLESCVAGVIPERA